MENLAYGKMRNGELRDEILRNDMLGNEMMINHRCLPRRGGPPRAGGAPTHPEKKAEGGGKKKTEKTEMTGISDRISKTIALGTGIMLRKQFDDIKTQPRTQFRKRYTVPFAITPTNP